MDKALAVGADQEAVVIAIHVAGVEEILLGHLRIEADLLVLVGVAPIAAGEVAVDHLVLIEEQLVDQLLAVEEMREGQAHVLVVERRLAHVEDDAGEAVRRLVEDLAPLDPAILDDLLLGDLLDPALRAPHAEVIELVRLELLVEELAVADDDALDAVEVVGVARPLDVVGPRPTSRLRRTISRDSPFLSADPCP
jgi:hypothetical protein